MNGSHEPGFDFACDLIFALIVIGMFILVTGKILWSLFA